MAFNFACCCVCDCLAGGRWACWFMPCCKGRAPLGRGRTVSCRCTRASHAAPWTTPTTSLPRLSALWTRYCDGNISRDQSLIPALGCGERSSLLGCTPPARPSALWTQVVWRQQWIWCQTGWGLGLDQGRLALALVWKLMTSVFCVFRFPLAHLFTCWPTAQIACWDMECK